MPPRTINPTDCVEGLPDGGRPTLVDFWRWAYGDLCDDDVKGVYAEWVVHLLLGVTTRRRVSWANSDVITERGVRIEVKSTSYWQSWKFVDELGKPKDAPAYQPPPDDRRIRFSGLQAGDSVATSRSAGPDFKSQLYVFAFQGERALDRWNALDLAQWEFFLVPRQDLQALSSKSISLAALRARFGSLSASQLAEQGREMIRRMEEKGAD